MYISFKCSMDNVWNKNYLILSLSYLNILLPLKHCKRDWAWQNSNISPLQNINHLQSSDHFTCASRVSEVPLPTRMLTLDRTSVEEVKFSKLQKDAFLSNHAHSKTHLGLTVMNTVKPFNFASKIFRVSQPLNFAQHQHVAILQRYMFNVRCLLILQLFQISRKLRVLQ